ncbi:MAG: ExeA family protein, partial [Magnetospiraceae bacterium]
MYFDYFGIQESPFSITPDPKFMYFSQRYEEALAHLLYGIGEGGGFVLLTGEVGTGKTTVCRYILDQIPDTVDLALILNPKVSEVELLANICDELHIPYLSKDLSVKSLVDLLNKKLLELHAKDRRPVLIIDEAQNLAPQVLEQIRLLTNLETAKRKLLQIILVGQPELNEMLARPELRQVSQRVTARYHLYPLSKAETAAYIAHRLSVVDIRPDLFTAQALAMVYKLTRGVPRLVNVLCDRCLLAAFVKDVQRVGPVLVKDAYKDVQGPFKSLPRKPPSPWILGGLSGGAVAAALFLAYLAFGSGEMAEKPGNVDSVATPALAANVPPETATPNANQPIAAAPTSAAPAETASPTAAPQEVAAIDSVGDAASAPLVETPEAEAPVPSAAPAPAES